MPIQENVVYTPDSTGNASELRTLFCRESAAVTTAERNPLLSTNFNALLAAIAQEAFDEGRKYERKVRSLAGGPG